MLRNLPSTRNLPSETPFNALTAASVSDDAKRSKPKPHILANIACATLRWTPFCLAALLFLSKKPHASALEPPFVVGDCLVLLVPKDDRGDQLWLSVVVGKDLRCAEPLNRRRQNTRHPEQVGENADTNRISERLLTT